MFFHIQWIVAQNKHSFTRLGRGNTQKSAPYLPLAINRAGLFAGLYELGGRRQIICLKQVRIL
jgi:hypothetical protein